jgi:hypothetical protein
LNINHNNKLANMKLTVLVLAAVATVAFAGGGSKKNDDALCAACRDVYMPCKHVSKHFHMEALVHILHRKLIV